MDIWDLLVPVYRTLQGVYTYTLRPCRSRPYLKSSPCFQTAERAEQMSSYRPLLGANRAPEVCRINTDNTSSSIVRSEIGTSSLMLLTQDLIWPEYDYPTRLAWRL